MALMHRICISHRDWHVCIYGVEDSALFQDYVAADIQKQDPCCYSRWFNNVGTNRRI